MPFYPKIIMDRDLETSMQSLLENSATFLFQLKRTLLCRSRAGDLFVRYVRETELCRDLADILHRIPFPTTIPILPPSFYIDTYNAVLYTKQTVFEEIAGNLTCIASPSDFVSNLMHTHQIPPVVWFASLVYMDRIIASTPSLFLSTSNLTAFLSGVLLAAFWAYGGDSECRIYELVSRMSGIGMERLIGLEKTVIHLLDYDFYVTKEESFNAQVGLEAWRMSIYPEEEESDYAVNDDPVYIQASKISDVLREYNYYGLGKGRVSMVSAPTGLLIGDEEDDIRVREAFRALALCQLKHDFGDVLLRGKEIMYRVMATYSERAVYRLYVLLEIVQGSWNETRLFSIQNMKEDKTFESDNKRVALESYASESAAFGRGITGLLNCYMNCWKEDILTLDMRRRLLAKLDERLDEGLYAFCHYKHVDDVGDECATSSERSESAMESTVSFATSFE